MHSPAESKWPPANSAIERSQLNPVTQTELLILIDQIIWKVDTICGTPIIEWTAFHIERRWTRFSTNSPNLHQKLCGWSPDCFARFTRVHVLTRISRISNVNLPMRISLASFLPTKFFYDKLERQANFNALAQSKFQNESRRWSSCEMVNNFFRSSQFYWPQKAVNFCCSKKI